MNVNLPAKTAIIVFVRHPQLGKVKTRLAKAIGDEKALKVYKTLLQHTFNVVRAIPVQKFIFYADEMPEHDLWTAPGFIRSVQQGDDLGDRMHYAFQHVFNQGFGKVLIIGSDCYQLQEEHVLSAVETLQTHDMILGRAIDGGYYLLGMSAFYPTFFKNKVWSTNQVAAETIKDAQSLQLKYSLLPILSDVDEFEDLATSGITI